VDELAGHGEAQAPGALRDTLDAAVAFSLATVRTSIRESGPALLLFTHELEELLQQRGRIAAAIDAEAGRAGVLNRMLVRCTILARIADDQDVMWVRENRSANRKIGTLDGFGGDITIDVVVAPRERGRGMSAVVWVEEWGTAATGQVRHVAAKVELVWMSDTGWQVNIADVVIE
jgi:hypothetical protein